MVPSSQRVPPGRAGQPPVEDGNQAVFVVLAARATEFDSSPVLRPFAPVRARYVGRVAFDVTQFRRMGCVKYEKLRVPTQRARGTLSLALLELGHCSAARIDFVRLSGRCGPQITTAPGR